ncbi:ATP-binding cassette domain-containing protein [Streptomyces finlayi]|uniref:ATP-binding cassette domain-containing protein n=1 Tax=Streptomyces finlayi TaxID=67296 RepID=UPI0027E4DAEB|nr:ATP-binding cassette domain-containing protein [Streptomyces finlayi]
MIYRCSRHIAVPSLSSQLGTVIVPHRVCCQPFDEHTCVRPGGHGKHGCAGRSLRGGAGSGSPRTRECQGPVTAVDGVDLRIMPGEVFGVLGPSGSGTSATTGTPKGHRSRAEGTVRALGTDPAVAGHRNRSRTGVVRQDESAPAELTVRETMTHFARYCPRPRDAGGGHRPGRSGTEGRRPVRGAVRQLDTGRRLFTGGGPGASPAPPPGVMRPARSAFRGSPRTRPPGRPLPARPTPCP